MRLRLTAAAVALSVAGVALPAGASAQANFSAACTPTTITFPGATQITCTLTVTTGAAEEKFAVSARSPRFGGEGEDAEFSTLLGSGLFQLAGPGDLGTGAFSTPGVLACSPFPRGWHGFIGGGGKQDVTIPANSTSFLSTTFGALEAPWPGDSLAPYFEVSNQMVSNDTSTLASPITVRTAEPVRTGQSGVRILFSTRPRTDRQPGAAATVKKGKPIVISGRTDPVLRNQKLSLRTVGPFKKLLKVKPVGHPVTTDRRGRFKTTFEPERGGRYSIAMFFRSKSAKYADGYTCARSFNVGN